MGYHLVLVLERHSHLASQIRTNGAFYGIHTLSLGVRISLTFLDFHPLGHFPSRFPAKTSRIHLISHGMLQISCRTLVAVVGGLRKPASGTVPQCYQN